MERFKPLPPQALLNELFDYSLTTGLLYWRTGTWKGHTAGCVKSRIGYLSVRISKQSYMAHRIIWALVTGDDPGQLQIDHIDRCRANNAWVNLRLATSSANKCNRGPQSNGTSGFKGVSFFKPKGKWRARINVLHTEHHIGYFDSPEEANIAYIAAAEQIHGEFAPSPNAA